MELSRFFFDPPCRELGLISSTAGEPKVALEMLQLLDKLHAAGLTF